MSGVVLTVEVEDWDERTLDRVRLLLDATADALHCVDTVTDASVRCERVEE